jgi:hypothetical protein
VSPDQPQALQTSRQEIPLSAVDFVVSKDYAAPAEVP